MYFASRGTPEIPAQFRHPASAPLFGGFSLPFPKVVGRDQFWNPSCPACSHTSSSCANSLWYPDSAESLENPRDISKRYFGPSFLSSSPLSPATQSVPRGRLDDIRPL